MPIYNNALTQRPANQLAYQSTIGPMPRNEYLGALADFLAGSYSAERTQQMQGISKFLGVPAVSQTLDRLSYGEPLTTGAGGLGGTTRIRPEVLEAALTVAPLAQPVTMASLQAARLARQAAFATGRTLGPTAARNEAGAFNLYHGGELVKTPNPDKQGLFTDGVPGVSFTPNIVEAARYAKHNMGSINAIDASGLKIYQGGNKSLDAAYKAGDFSAIKKAGFDGLKFQNSSEYVLFDPEKVFSLPRKVAEQNVNRKVGGDMRQFLDWKDVGN